MPVCGMDMRVGGRYQWRWRRDKGGRCRHPRPALDSMPRMPPAAASVLPGGQAEGSPPRTLRVGRSPRSATTVPPRQSARGGSATAERAGWKRRGPRWRCQWGRRPRRARTVAGGPEPPQGRRLWPVGRSPRSGRTVRVGRSPPSATTVPPRQSGRGGSAAGERARWKRRGRRWRGQSAGGQRRRDHGGTVRPGNPRDAWMPGSPPPNVINPDRLTRLSATPPGRE